MKFPAALVAIFFFLTGPSSAAPKEAMKIASKPQLLVCTVDVLVTHKRYEYKFLVDEAKQTVDGQPATITANGIVQILEKGTTGDDKEMLIDRYTGTIQFATGERVLMQGTCEAAQKRF